jgi:hypothetical protein
MAEKPADGVVKPSLEKLKALQLAMDKIEKDHGKGTIMKMGDSKVEDMPVTQLRQRLFVQYSRMICRQSTRHVVCLVSSDPLPNV